MQDKLEQEISKYPVIEEFRVQWNHMDSANHVNNTIYLRWCESVRISYFAAMGMDISFTGEEVGPILGWQDCKYIFPLTYPDVAICGARVIEFKEDRFIMECAVYSQTHKRIAAISNQSIVPYDYKNLKKSSIPKSWLDSISKLEKEALSLT